MSSITKKALSHALKDLLNERPLKKVTVGMIAERCGMNRQTFYYHFRDIPDLLSWTFEEDAKERLSSIKESDLSWEKGFYAIFVFLSEDKRFVLNVYHSVGWEALQEYIYRMIRPFLLKAVNAHPSNMGVPEKERAFAADFYKYALTGIVLDWIKNGMVTNPKEVAGMTFKMFDAPIPISHEMSKDTK